MPAWTLKTIICVKYITYKVRAKALLMKVDDYFLLSLQIITAYLKQLMILLANKMSIRVDVQKTINIQEARYKHFYFIFFGFKSLHLYYQKSLLITNAMIRQE